MSELDSMSAIIARWPDSFDERQRPKCGVWSYGAPCICGDPANHEPGGKFAPAEN